MSLTQPTPVTRAVPHRASRSTTRPCATARSSRASRSPSRTSCGSPSSSTGSASHYIEGGWPGRQPEGRRVLPARADRAAARRRRRSSRSARPAGSRARSTATTRCATSSRPDVGTVCIVGKSWDYHVHRGAADHARRGRGDGRRLGRVPARRRAAGAASTPSTSSTATSATPSSRCACSRPRPPKGADHARAVRHQRRLAAARGRAHRRRGRRLLRRRRARSASTLHDDTGCARRQRARRRCSAAPRQVQGTINGYGERTGNCNLTTIIPNLTLKMGIETLPDGPPRAAHAGEPPRRRAGEHAAQPAGAVRRARRRSRTRPGCTRRAIAKRPDAYEHVDPTSSATAPASSCRSSAGESTHRAEGQGARPRARRSAARRAWSRRSSGSSTRATTSRSPTRSLELLMRRATGWEQDCFRGRVVPGHHRRPPTATARRRDRRDGRRPRRRSRCWVGGERVIATAEGNGPVNALDRALRAALNGRFPALERVHLTDYKVRVLDTPKGTGAVTRVLIDSTDGERTWTTIGVEREHHRSVVAGAARLDRLRPAPHA